jgi:hypothetical protein
LFRKFISFIKLRVSKMCLKIPAIRTYKNLNCSSLRNMFLKINFNNTILLLIFFLLFLLFFFLLWIFGRYPEYSLLCFFIPVTLMAWCFAPICNTEQFSASCRSLPSRMFFGFPTELLQWRLPSRILLLFCYQTAVL